VAVVFWTQCTCVNRDCGPLRYTSVDTTECACEHKGSQGTRFLHQILYDRSQWISPSGDLNPLMGTLKPQINGPLYSNTVIGTLAVDGWAVHLAQRGGVWAKAAAPPSLLFYVPNATARPSRPVYYQLHIKFDVALLLYKRLKKLIRLGNSFIKESWAAMEQQWNMFPGRRLWSPGSPACQRSSALWSAPVYDRSPPFNFRFRFAG